MTLTPLQTLVTILAVALGCAITRFAPFLLFPENREPPKVILYLGRVLPPAMMGLLVVYCLKGVSLVQAPHALPEALAILTTVLLHKWKKNVLLSIGVSTALYMALVQALFV